MGREAARDARRSGSIDEGIEVRFEMTAGDGETMRGHLAGPMAIADAQGLLHALHLRREAALAMIPSEQATAAQQMRETGLMRRVGKAPVRRPAIAHQHTTEVGAEDHRGFFNPRGRAGCDRPSCRGWQTPTATASARGPSSRFHPA
jgi:hypothetical protein